MSDDVAAHAFEPPHADPYGVRPLFEWAAPAGVVRGGLLELLDAGAPADFDFDALSVFLRVGFFLGNDTPFLAVRAVPPLIEPYTGPAATLTRDEAIDAFIAAFDAAIHRCLPTGPYQMPLSGGRDSRHILCALIAAGHPPAACVTIEHFPPRGNDDVAVAAALCGRLGVPHRVLAQRQDRVSVEIEKNHRTHFCTDEHAQFVALADYLAGNTSETYDGIAGDVLSQSGYLDPAVHALFERRAVGDIARYILDGYGTMVSEHALATLLEPRQARLVTRERALARLVREITRHLDAPNPVASFFFWNRTRREIALSPFALMGALRVHTPYLDAAVYALLSAMPAALQMDRRLHTDAIGRAYPAIADQPYETKTVRQVRRGFHRRTAVALARVLARHPGMLGRRRLLPGILVTILDGDGERLWHTSLSVYLAQLGALARRAR